jgi:hypothetical protein
LNFAVLAGAGTDAFPESGCLADGEQLPLVLGQTADDAG